MCNSPVASRFSSQDSGSSLSLAHQASEVSREILKAMQITEAL